MLAAQENMQKSLDETMLKSMIEKISHVEYEMKECKNSIEKKKIEKQLEKMEEKCIKLFKLILCNLDASNQKFFKKVNNVVDKSGITFALDQKNNTYGCVPTIHIKYFLYKWCFENNMYNNIFTESILKTMVQFLTLDEFSHDSTFFAKEWKVYPNSDYEDRKEDLEKLSKEVSLYEHLGKFIFRKDYKNIRLILQSDIIMSFDKIIRALEEEKFDTPFSKYDVEIMEQILTTVKYNDPFTSDESLVLKLKDKEYLMNLKDEYRLKYLSLMYPLLNSKIDEENMFKSYSKALIVGRRNQQNL